MTLSYRLLRDFGAAQHVKGAAIPTQKWVDQIYDPLAAVVD